jgi:hypothetical protein
MSDVLKTLPIVVRLPAALGLTEREVQKLAERWEADVVKAAAAANPEAKIHFTIRLNIEISND